MSGTETIALHFQERVPIGKSDQLALVFLHHFGGSSRAWGAVMELMVLAGFRCIAPDLRGFGDSSPKPKEPGSTRPATIAQDLLGYSVAQMAKDVLSLVWHLHLQSYILVGHSMGGKVALAIAAQRPAGLQALILLAPSPPTPEPMTSEERARLLQGFGIRAAAEVTLGRIAERPLPASLASLAIEDNMRASAPAWRAWLESGSREDTSGQLDALIAPVTIAVGGADKAITEALVASEIVARLPRPAPVHIIPDAGHLLPLEAPAEIAELIRAATFQHVRDALGVNHRPTYSRLE